MSKSVPPPGAPPSYSQAVGGVEPSAPIYYSPYQSGFNVNPGFAVPIQSAQAPQTVVTMIVPLGPSSTHMVCPTCHAEINTTVKTEPGLLAFLSGGFLCFIGCMFGCCLIPCCIPSCMDVQHYCPNCKAFLGTFKRSL